MADIMLHVEFSDESNGTSDDRICRTCLDNLVPYYYADEVSPEWLTTVTAYHVGSIALNVNVIDPDGTHHFGRNCDLCGSSLSGDFYDANITTA